MAGASRFTRVLPALVSVAIIVVAGTVLYRALGRMDAVDVAARFTAIPTASIVLAAVFTVLAFTALAFYEVAMLKYIGSGIASWRPFLAALSAYPIGHAVGFGALSGGAVRYRCYSAAGLSAFDVGKVIVLSVLPYALGLSLLCALGLVTDSADAARLLKVSPAAAVAGGVLLLAAHAAWNVAVWRVRGPIHLRWFDMELPTPRMTAVQYGLGLVDSLSGIAVLYVLLPDGAGISFLTFASVYVIAIFIGLLSSVPAGLGVFESMLLLMLRDVDPEALLGSVLAYRLIFELAPFLVGVVLFLCWEGWTRWLPPARIR